MMGSYWVAGKTVVNTNIGAYIINAPASARDDFRRGVISGYGENAESALKKAMQDAQQQMSSSAPNDRATSHGERPRTND